MPKTGWKYTKQAPAKGSTNMLKRSNASSKQGRRAPKGHGNDSNMRSAETIARLKMYNNGKAIRNKEGTVVGGQFMMGDRAGDTKITSCEYDRSELRHIAFLFVTRMPFPKNSISYNSPWQCFAPLFHPLQRPDESPPIGAGSATHASSVRRSWTSSARK